MGALKQLASFVGGILVASTISTAALADSKLQDQVLGVTAQLNGNCSANLIYSNRDKESGDVTTVFLTAKHCVDDDKARMTVELPVYDKARVVKSDKYYAKVRGKDVKSDLALIELLDKDSYFSKVAKIGPIDGIPEMGEEVWTVGYPLGLQLTITDGMFGSLETFDFPTTGIEYFRATPNVVGGNSGGAMYRLNEAGDYELIGVTTAAHQIHSYIALYTPLEAIHGYLKVALPEALGIEPEKKTPATN